MGESAKSADIEQDQRIEDWNKNRRGGKPLKHFATWETFVFKFKKECTVRDKSGNAIEAIRSLVQGTMTCDKYPTQFKSLVIRTGYNEVALIEENKRGLHH